MSTKVAIDGSILLGTFQAGSSPIKPNYVEMKYWGLAH